MHIQERLIVPGLGVVILLSVFILDVLLVYKLLLGLLGLAAAGSYFAPREVQVETRIAIAALGLIILLIVSSTAFWLALLSFGAIAALQFPHRHTLQRNPATFAWLSAALKDVQARRSGRAEGGGDADEEAGVVAVAGDGESRPQAPLGVDTLPEFVRTNVAGVGCGVAGALVLMSVFLPWVGFLASAWGELAAGENLTLRAASEELGLSVLSVFFYLLIVLGLFSIISIALPRTVAAIIAAAGFAVTLASYFYVFAEVQREAAELSSLGVGVTTLPAVGSIIAGLAFLIMFVLQLIPKANTSRTEAS